MDTLVYLRGNPGRKRVAVKKGEGGMSRPERTHRLEEKAEPEICT